jgi:hypothetical protein
VRCGLLITVPERIEEGRHMNIKELFDFIVDFFSLMGWSLPFIFLALWEKVFRLPYYRWKYRKVKIDNSYILIIGLESNVDNMEAKINEEINNSLSNLEGLCIVKVPLPDGCTATTPVDLIAQLKALRKKMAKVSKYSVHLFYSGPVVLTAFIGGFFYNKDKVYIYHQDLHTKEYECWGPIGI